MNQFVFQMPTRVLFSAGQLKHLHKGGNNMEARENMAITNTR